MWQKWALGLASVLLAGLITGATSKFIEVIRLEVRVEQIQEDVAEIKIDMKAMRLERSQDIRDRQQQSND